MKGNQGLVLLGLGALAVMALSKKGVPEPVPEPVPDGGPQIWAPDTFDPSTLPPEVYETARAVDPSLPFLDLPIPEPVDAPAAPAGVPVDTPIPPEAPVPMPEPSPDPAPILEDSAPRYSVGTIFRDMDTGEPFTVSTVGLGTGEWIYSFSPPLLTMYPTVGEVALSDLVRMGTLMVG